MFKTQYLEKIPADNPLLSSCSSFRKITHWCYSFLRVFRFDVFNCCIRILCSCLARGVVWQHTRCKKTAEVVCIRRALVHYKRWTGGVSVCSSLFWSDTKDKTKRNFRYSKIQIIPNTEPPPLPPPASQSNRLWLWQIYNIKNRWRQSEDPEKPQNPQTGDRSK